MILIIRGHIRNSFYTSDLFNTIESIYNLDNNLKIYIHTWHIFANNISWSPKNHYMNYTLVTNEIIYTYFGKFKNLIEKIIIDNDSNIKLIGNLKGNINNGKSPLIGWKNYWYGKYQIIKYINDEKINENEIIINLRFDINNNSHSFFKEDIIIFIKQNINNKFKKNILIENNVLSPGIDNIYIGNINTMYNISYHFFHFLDDILNKYNHIINPETLVFLINNDIF